MNPIRTSYFFAVVAAGLLCSRGAAFSEESPPRPLRDIFEDAEQLAADPQKHDEAAARYRSVVARHRDNEQWYRAALRRLAQSYAESGQIEEGASFFIKLAVEESTTEKEKILGEILTTYRLKHPDVFQKVVTRMGLDSASRTPAARPIPSEELSQAILQRKDPVLREESLKKLQQMLQAGSPVAEKRQGLATLVKSLAAKFDREPFRRLVFPLLESDDATTRAMALRCLPGLEPAVSDMDKVIPLAQDESPQVRMNVGIALIQIGKGREAEKVIPALMNLLKDDDSAVVEQTIRSMWGQYSSPAFDALLIELSHDLKLHHNVVYFGLSTMRPKSLAVCRKLVEELADPDWNNSGRAAWGLTYGVADEAKSLVEQGLLKALPEETNAYTREQEFRALRNVATEQSRAYLAKVAGSDQEQEKFREMARAILAELDKSR